MPLFVRIALLVLGFVLFQFVPLAQLVGSWWGIFPIGLCFAVFALGLLGWGARLETRVGGGGASVFLLSSLVAVAFAMALGHLGLLGASHRWLFLTFLGAGLLAFPAGAAVKLIYPFRNRWLHLLLLFIFGLRFLSAYLPQAHGDPLLYHLMGPRLWNLQGVVKLNPDLPVALLAGSWEYFFLWPQVLFASGAAGVNELVLAQIFSQWIHLYWGLFGAILVWRELIRPARSVIASELTEFLFLCVVLFVASLQWTAPLAKNDVGVAFWCLGAWLYLARGDRSYWWLGGLFAGLAVAAKINAILFLIPLASLKIYVRFRNDGNRFSPVSRWLIGAGALGFIMGVGPVYFRNWWETKNPFYTMFSHWFPGPWVSQSWANHFSTHQPTSGNWAELIVYRFHQFGGESPAFFLLALIPLAWLHRPARARLREMKEWYLLFAGSCLLLIVAVRHDAELRYLGPSLWIGAALGLHALLAFLRDFPDHLRKTGTVLLLLGLLASSKLPTHFLWKFPGIQPGEATVMKHTAGAAKAWLRKNLPPGKLVVLSGDNETYYLSTVRSTVLTERPDIDAATYQQADLDVFLRGLCATSGAAYLLDSRDASGLRHRFPNTAWDKSVLFEAEGARVYDLVRLQRQVIGEDAGCGRT